MLGIFATLQIILQNITHLLIWFYTTIDVIFCSFLAGLMIFMNNQNLENIHHDKLKIWWNKNFPTNIQNWPTYHMLLPWHYYLDVYNVREVQTCGLTSLFDIFNKSNLTLFTVLDWWNLRVANTLQHRWRSNLIVWNNQFAIVLLSRCFQLKMSTNWWIDQSFWQSQQIEFNTLYCAEPVKP